EEGKGRQDRPTACSGPSGPVLAFPTRARCSSAARSGGPMRAVRAQFLAALLMAAPLLSACGASNDKEVESRLRRELPSVLGRADRYDVAVQGVDDRTSSAARVDVVGYRIRPRQGP